MRADSMDTAGGRKPGPRAGGSLPRGVVAVLLVLLGVGGLGAAGTTSLGLSADPAATPGPRSGPDGPCAAPPHRQFDFWIGEWDVTNRQRDPSRPDDETLYRTGTSTARVYAILDGCAVVEHWEGRLLPDRHVLGFSVRAWDPEREAWIALLNWPGPRGPSFFTMEGTYADSVATFEAEGTAGRRVRYRFRDIRADGFRWVGARRHPEEERWTPFWVMDFRRRDPRRDPALFNGPARGTERCPGERARTYDFLVGDWVGEAEPGEDAGVRPVTLRAWPILEGCAVMEFVTLGEGDAARELFRVRSFVPREGRWVQYTVRQTSPVLVRWEGEGDDDHTLTRTAAGSDGRATRVRFREIRAGSFVREVRASSDGGATWSTVSRTRFRRR